MVATDAEVTEGILMDVVLEALILLTEDLADITGNGERLALCNSIKNNRKF